MALSARSSIVYGSSSLVISEFLADPETPLKTEWVELKNCGDEPIDLQGWQLGDALTRHLITNSEVIVNGGDYLVLAADTAAFILFYGRPNYQFLQLSGWSILNNDGDLIRLEDNSGLIIDSFRYSYTYDNNLTWARGEEPGKTDRWGRSIAVGGTPGYPNQVYYQASASSIKVKAEPNPFSPRKDGRMSISFSLPAGDKAAIKIYDLEGRIVKSLLEIPIAMDGTVFWNGTSDAGRRLPVGIYILYLEVYNCEHYKQTIVIAP